jgi:3-oxoadipate enol-lactonase
MALPGSTEEPAPVVPGRAVELPGRGTTFVRDLSGPPGAPTLILLHGFVATSGVNWLTSFERLGRRFRVLAPDLRGHGRGLRSREGFRFTACADDVAALAAELGVERAIVGGYSMGGPIAQLVWRRHRDLVAGLVLAATAYRMVPSAQLRILIASCVGAIAQATRIAEIATHLPLPGVRGLLPTPVPTTGSLGRWAANEIRRHQLRGVVEAILEMGAFDAEPWIGEIDVPTAVVLTTRDAAVDPLWQLRLARAIPGATVHHVAQGHLACGHSLFAEVFADACAEVADRPLPV